MLGHSRPQSVKLLGHLTRPATFSFLALHCTMPTQLFKYSAGLEFFIFFLPCPPY